jgi:hypothetical protein
MKLNDYEGQWQDRINEFRPEASDADWASMQEALASRPTRGTSSFSRMYWLLVPVLLLAGYWWAVTPEVGRPPEATAVAVVEPLPVRPATILLPSVELDSLTAVSVAASIGPRPAPTTIDLPPRETLAYSISPAPAPRRPLLVPVEPLVGLPIAAPLSRTAEPTLANKLNNLAVRAHTSRHPGTNGFYPRTRIRE